MAPAITARLWQALTLGLVLALTLSGCRAPQEEPAVEEPTPAVEEPTPAAEEPAAEEPAPAAPEPEPEHAEPGTFAAGQYEIADVQVREDHFGEFAVGARVTNTGEAVELVVLTATLFNGGSVVGTAEAAVDGFDAGTTRTVEFLSLDEYGPWDGIEFTVAGQL
jgi:hypothetical protein